MPLMTPQADRVLRVDALADLITALHARGYRVVGPVVRDGAIVYGELSSADDLPVGWTEVNKAGAYGLKQRDDEARFGFAVGPHSWKQFLFPPRLRLWRGERGDGTIELAAEPPPEQPYAFFGVRGCDLHAIAIQDRVLMGGRYIDHDYAARREAAFVVAVECGEPGGTCFCTSMGTGPAIHDGFDLRLTELLDERDHRFLVRVGSPRGAEVLADVPHSAAATADRSAAAAVVEQSAQRMGRALDTDDLRDLLLRNLDHARWEEVANRCLSCGNCTMVCPTCFCTGVEEVNDLSGEHAERWRSWDTCFSVEHGYVHGGSVRPSTRSRYRQWMTHKLATWHDQFGTSGCVGCGRCITWCPVGIDITEEVAAIRADDANA